MECESSTVISIDSLILYKNKYYLQVYLENCTYKNVLKERIDLGDNPFETNKDDDKDVL